MNYDAIALPYRVRLYWSDIEAALTQLRSGSFGEFRATLDGNFPAIDFKDCADTRALLLAFPTARACDKQGAMFR